MMRKALIKTARAGNKLLNLCLVLLAVVLLAFGGYSLWDTFLLYKNAYASEELLQYKPVGSTESAGSGFMQLQKLNPDVKAWLTVDDTHIDYPVLQGENNLEYVNKDVNGKYSASGAIFMDSENNADFKDPYTILYGHNMENGAMFGDIKKYQDKDYFEKHKSGILYVNGTEYQIQFYALMQVDAYDPVIFNVTDLDAQGIHDLLQYVDENAIQTIGAAIEGSNLIALSTCTEETNGRLVLMGQINTPKRSGDPADIGASGADGSGNISGLPTTEPVKTDDPTDLLKWYQLLALAVILCATAGAGFYLKKDKH